jgi:hypothetical protein
MSDQTESVSQALRTYVNDMIALDKHILEAVERQCEDENVKSDTQVIELVDHIRNRLGHHVSDLETHVARLGSGVGATVKQAVTSVLGVAAGLYDKVRKDPVSRMLRDDYTALNLAAISNTMLHTTALALRDQAVADTALSHLRDLVPLIMHLNEIVPYVVADELTDEGSVNANAAPEAVSNTQAAWKR